MECGRFLLKCGSRDDEEDDDVLEGGLMCCPPIRFLSEDVGYDELCDVAEDGRSILGRCCCICDELLDMPRDDDDF